MNNTEVPTDHNRKFLTEEYLNAIDSVIPQTIAGNKSPTLNGTGYVFFTPSPLAQSFLQEECKPGKKVLDIGSGYNDIPLNAVKNGVGEYVANDICEEHLSILFKKLNLAGLSEEKKLKFLLGKAPDILNQFENQFDAILADKVMHFFNPNEIKVFVELIKKSLKNNGKFYVTTASPYSPLYQEILPSYLARKKEGEEFPGFFNDVMTRLNHNVLEKNYQQYKVPNAMTLFDSGDLVDLFEKNGTKIIKSFCFKIPTAEQESWLECAEEESNIAGVIGMVSKP